MPILPKEPCTFPEDLFDASFERGGESARWWVLRTRSQSEKKLARKLQSDACSYFLPLYKKTWRSGNRRGCAYKPLFPGYLFLYGDEAARLKALKTNLVVQVLEVSDQSRLWFDLHRAYLVTETEMPLMPEEKMLAGTKVQIFQGPLAGMNGTLIRKGTQNRFFVEVEFLKQGLSIEIEGWMLCSSSE